MNIKQYQIECKRTCTDLGGDLNRQHMLMGVISEIGEIVDAYKKELAYNKPFDRVNLKEEVADVLWYLCNWATFELKDITSLFKDQTFIEETSKSNIDYIFDFLDRGLDFGNPIFTINNWYGLCFKLGLTHEEIETGLENNINKLKVRFPDKFTTENALNRNLEAERKELEK